MTQKLNSPLCTDDMVMLEQGLQQSLDLFEQYFQKQALAVELVKNTNCAPEEFQIPPKN